MTVLEAAMAASTSTTLITMASVKLSAHLAIFTPVTTSKAMEQLWLTSGLWQLQSQSQLLSGPLIARGTMASLVHLSPALAREFYI